MYSHIAEARRDGERKIEWWRRRVSNRVQEVLYRQFYIFSVAI